MILGTQGWEKLGGKDFFSFKQGGGWGIDPGWNYACFFVFGYWFQIFFNKAPTLPWKGKMGHF